MELIAELLPQYRCHKIVRAAKIARIDPTGLVLEYSIGAGIAAIGVDVTPAFFARHRPEVGGYFVVYDDGYQSFSPAKAFEEGYSLKKD